jgi:hypothetical protein
MQRNVRSNTWKAWDESLKTLMLRKVRPYTMGKIQFHGTENHVEVFFF